MGHPVPEFERDEHSIDFARISYDTDNLIWVWDVTTTQDKKITENNDAGVQSSRYRPGPYSMHEAKVAGFIRWYLNGIR